MGPAPTPLGSSQWGSQMTSESHDIRQLQRAVKEFCDARDWGKFHDPKNLSMAIAVEAGELMDHFRWVDNSGSIAVLSDATSRLGVEEEVADVLILLLEFANVTRIDLAHAVERKLEKNAVRYPVELARGNAIKHDRLDLAGGGPASSD